jgi:flagellar motor switch protein FliN/FliY
VSDEKVAASGLDKAEQAHSLEDLRVEAELRIGTTTLPLRSLLGITVGEVIALDRPLAAPVQVVVGGRTVASGELVLVDGCFAVRIDTIAALKMHLPGDGTEF